MHSQKAWNERVLREYRLDLESESIIPILDSAQDPEGIIQTTPQHTIPGCKQR